MKRMKSQPENKISETSEPITDMKNEDRRSIWYILLLALAPLYLLAIIGAILVALVTLSRHLVGTSDFFLQQKIYILIIIIGMIIALIVFTVSVINAHRKIGMLRQSGQIRQANMGLFVLTIVASIMLLPIILALFFH